MAAIRGNHYCGGVGGFPIPHLSEGARVSVVSAYFSIYAYAALKDRLLRLSADSPDPLAVIKAEGRA